MKCSKCGKSLIGIHGEEIVAKTISRRTMDRVNFEKQFGKFSDQNDYHFCFECVLDSLMSGAVVMRED